MVPRYSRPQYRHLSAETVQICRDRSSPAEAMGKSGMLRPKTREIRAAYDNNVLGEIDIAAIDEIEAVTKHDVIAF